MHQIVWQKINNIKYRVVLELRECRDRLIVQPGDRTNIVISRVDCLRKWPKLLSLPSFPGSDMMSAFWDNLKSDRNVHELMITSQPS